MKIFQPGTAPNWNRILIYGNPKCGKTRLATSIPWGEGRWGDKAIYVAADPLGEELDSVTLVDRSHLIVVKPGPEESQKKYDPYVDACAIASRDWGVDTMVWDTGTATAESFLQQFAQMGEFISEKKDPITYGKQGDPSFIAFPTIGDYGAAQRAVLHWLNLLFMHQKNLIVICHAQFATLKKAGSAEVLGGPASIGESQVKTIAGMFPSVIHLVGERKKQEGMPTEQRIVAHMSPHAAWLAGVRGASSYMPDTVLDQPHPVRYWRDWTKYKEQSE